MKRLTIALADEVHAELARLAEEQGCDIPELVKRSVALTLWVWEHRDAPVFAEVDGEVAKLVFFGGSGR